MSEQPQPQKRQGQEPEVNDRNFNYELHDSAIVFSGKVSIELPPDCNFVKLEGRGLHVSEVAAFGEGDGEVRIMFASLEQKDNKSRIFAIGITKNPKTDQFEPTGIALPLDQGNKYHVGRRGNLVSSQDGLAYTYDEATPDYTVSNDKLFGRVVNDSVSSNHLTISLDQDNSIHLEDHSANGTRLAHGMGSEAVSVEAVEEPKIEPAQSLTPAEELDTMPVPDEQTPQTSNTEQMPQPEEKSQSDDLQQTMERADAMAKEIEQHLDKLEAAQHQEQLVLDDIHNGLQALMTQVSSVAEQGSWQGNYLSDHADVVASASRFLNETDMRIMQLQIADGQYGFLADAVGQFDIGLRDDENKYRLAQEISELSQALTPLGMRAQRYYDFLPMINSMRNYVYEPNVTLSDLGEYLGGLNTQLGVFAENGRMNVAAIQRAKEAVQKVSQHAAQFASS